jgi:hypothetical protein
MPETHLLSATDTRRLRHRYEQLKTRLASLGPISQGSLMHQPPGLWRWTRKLNAKTVTVALSQEQAAFFRQAIANHRVLENTIRKMRSLSQQLLLGSAKGVRKRNRLNRPKSAYLSAIRVWPKLVKS